MVLVPKKESVVEPVGERRVEVPMQIGFVRLGGMSVILPLVVEVVPRREMMPIGRL